MGKNILSASGILKDASKRVYDENCSDSVQESCIPVIMSHDLYDLRLIFYIKLELLKL